MHRAPNDIWSAVKAKFKLSSAFILIKEEINMSAFPQYLQLTSDFFSMKTILMMLIVPVLSLYLT